MNVVILSRHQERFSEHDIETQYCYPLIISKGVVTGMKVAGNMEEHTGSNNQGTINTTLSMRTSHGGSRSGREFLLRLSNHDVSYLLRRSSR